MRYTTTSVAASPIAFARVTTLAASVVAATAALDLVVDSVNLSLGWTVLVMVLALGVAATPVLLGNRFHPAAGIVGCWLFAAVTSLQIAAGSNQIMTVNNLVLYPMISCYLGWFFHPAVARATVAAQFALSGVALVVSDHPEVFTTWANLVLASCFCLETARYLCSRLDRQLVSDGLTGAMNRLGLAQRLRAELDRSTRTGAPLTVAAIDLDGFKLINDRLGHLAGDQALVAVVAQLRRSLRPSDTVARVGGDEFVVLLPDTTRDAAIAILSRLQAGSDTPWTFGLVAARPSDSMQSLISRADEDLYVHKNRRSRSRTLPADLPTTDRGSSPHAP